MREVCSRLYRQLPAIDLRFSVVLIKMPDIFKAEEISFYRIR